MLYLWVVKLPDTAVRLDVFDRTLPPTFGIGKKLMVSPEFKSRGFLRPVVLTGLLLAEAFLRCRRTFSIISEKGVSSASRFRDELRMSTREGGGSFTCSS